MSYLVLLVSIVFSHSFPQDDPLYFAQDMDEFIQVREDIQKLEDLHRGCDWELENKSFPFYCLTEMEIKLSSPQNLKKFRTLRQKMSLICAQSVGQVSNIEELERWVDSSLLNHSCRQAIKSRILDLQYIESKAIGADLELSVLHGKFKSQKSYL